MILLSRLDHSCFVLNCAHIVAVEATPDTVLTLTTGEKRLVRESVEEVVRRSTAYLRLLGGGPALWSTAPRGENDGGVGPSDV